jgi:hypothetical protein
MTEFLCFNPPGRGDFLGARIPWKEAAIQTRAKLTEPPLGQVVELDTTTNQVGNAC